MNARASLKRLLQPSLGKVGLFGIALTLALLATTPQDPAPILQGQAQPVTDTVINSQVPVTTKASYLAKGKRS